MVKHEKCQVAGAGSRRNVQSSKEADDRGEPSSRHGMDLL